MIIKAISLMIMNSPLIIVQNMTLAEICAFGILNPLMPGVHQKVTHTLTNLQLSDFLGDTRY